MLQVPIPEADQIARAARDAGLFGIDGFGLVVVALFGLLGAHRGLWWQAVRLAGLLGAALAARALAPWLGSQVEGSLGDVDPRLVHGVLWIVSFIAALAAFAMLGKLGRKALEAMQLGPLDRVGGLLAGLVTGLLVHSALVAGLLQVGSQTWAAEAVLGTRSGQLVEALTDELPLLYRRAQSASAEGLELIDDLREGDAPLSPNRVR